MQVDSYIPDLSACITDENEVVRGQALALLANLLQKVTDWLCVAYIKRTCHA